MSDLLSYTNAKGKGAMERKGQFQDTSLLFKDNTTNAVTRRVFLKPFQGRRGLKFVINSSELHPRGNTKACTTLDED